jgi:hypothetical protein
MTRQSIASNGLLVFAMDARVRRAPDESTTLTASLSADCGPVQARSFARTAQEAALAARRPFRYIGRIQEEASWRA